MSSHLQHKNQKHKLQKTNPDEPTEDKHKRERELNQAAQARTYDMSMENKRLKEGCSIQLPKVHNSTTQKHQREQKEAKNNTTANVNNEKERPGNVCDGLATKSWFASKDKDQKS